MNNEFKKDMEKIVTSDELKNKIKLAAAKKIAENSENEKKKKLVYIKYASICAACLALVVSVYSASRYFSAPVSDDGDNHYVSMSKNPLTEKSDKNKSYNNLIPKESDENITNVPENGTENTKAPDNKKENAGGAYSSETNPRNDDAVSSPNGTYSDTDISLSGTDSDMSGESDVNIPAEGGTAIPDADETDGPVLSGNLYCDAESIDEARELLGYDFKAPSYIPDCYLTGSITVISGKIAQISYLCADDGITYRTARGSDDISGDYNSYSDEETKDVSNLSITFKSNGEKTHLAVWSDGESSYSISSSSGISKDIMEKIALGVTDTKTTQ